ncbi:hypothetical protein AGLY_015578 [Aphis glycines]|uniref:Uncharacterized protein n=1 Tax=Aphis glycines TaxID=307491 RepID=A0A6G0T1Y4_APHGL|nr:hypothetical protein AGLY_015578 [Aphis glycines]
MVMSIIVIVRLLKGYSLHRPDIDNHYRLTVNGYLYFNWHISLTFFKMFEVSEVVISCECDKYSIRNPNWLTIFNNKTKHANSQIYLNYFLFYPNGDHICFNRHNLVTTHCQHSIIKSILVEENCLIGKMLYILVLEIQNNVTMSVILMQLVMICNRPVLKKLKSLGTTVQTRTGYYIKYYTN